MPLPDAIARDTAASPRWLSIVGVGEDGVDGLSAAARGLIGAAEIVFGGRRHLSLAAPLIRGAARPWPTPFDARRRRGAASPRPANLCARVGRSVPLWRRRRAGAHDRRPRDDRGAGALGFQPGSGTARLVVAGNGAALGARPRARSGASAFATWRAHFGIDLRRRWAGCSGAAAGGNWFRRIKADGARGVSAARVSVFVRRPRRPTASMPSIHSIRSQSKSRLRWMRASSRVRPVFATIFSSTTARLPSARYARSRCRRWRRGAASYCGISAPAPDRSRSNGCSPTLRCAPSRSSNVRSAPHASAATLQPLACRDLRSWKPLRRLRLRALRRPMPFSSVAARASTGVLDTAIGALRSGGRSVVNAVTLATEALLIERHVALGGELTRVAIARTGAVGEKSGWRPAMPVTQWVWTKP